MEDRKLLILKKSLVALSIIVFAVILRLIPHPPNIAPIGALALFGGFYLNRKYSLIVPVAAMFLSDIFLGFHSTMPFVYLSFLLTGFIALNLREKRSINTVASATLVSSFLFFFITNLGVFLVSGLYPKTMQGFIDCFVLAIPFFRNSLIGDLLYVSLFFGSFEFISNLLKEKYGYLYKKRG